MQYVVVTVEDDELPEGIHHVIVERTDAPPLLLINGPPARCWRFMRAWEGTVEPPSLLPTILRLAG